MKFHVKDENGEVFEVEEIEETPAKKDEEPQKTHDEGLTEEEISALKGLAAVAEKLMKLVAETQDECGKDEDEDEDEETEDEEIDKDEQIEEVIDTDETEEKAKSRDSKKSVGAIEKRTKTDDSLTDSLDVESAWAKRYGGK